MQRTNITTVLLLVSTSFILVGCGGPTNVGLEARKDAYARIDKVNTQIGYSQARQAFETGQLREALELIVEAVDRYPQAAEYNLLHGRVLIELHRLDEARSALEAAIAVNEQQAEAYYFLGIIYQRWSEDEQAYDHYKKACAIDVGRPQYLLATAETLVSLRRYDEADALVHANLRSFEHHPSFRHLLGQIAQLRGDQSVAARLYEEASILQPDNAQLLEELACAQFAAEEFSGCLGTLQILAARQHEFNAQLNLLNARCLVHTNQMLDARPYAAW
jgi:tetratricopeptide (TPR) repeat protein